jgi:flagellar hook-length control protein FliK
MNAINLASIPGGALPQQAVSGASQPALADGTQFALWLGQYGAANAGCGVQLNVKQLALAEKLPATLLPLIQQLASKSAAQTASVTEASKPTLDAMLQALLNAVLDSLRGVLDAGGQDQVTAQLGLDQQPSAGDTATAASTKAASAAGVPAALKQAAVMWLQNEPVPTRQAAVMWLQGEEAPLKQAAVMWLQGDSPLKQATQIMPQAAAQPSTPDSQAGMASAPGVLDPDVSQLLLDVWPKLAAQLQTLLLNRYGVAAQVGQLTPQTLAASQAPMPWASAALANGTEPSSTSAAGNINLANASAITPAGATDLAQAPASIRWFASGGLSNRQAQSAASAVQAGISAEALTPAIAGDAVLPNGAVVKVIVTADSQVDLASLQPAGLELTQPAAERASFTVNLISPDQEQPLLTAQLCVRRIAEPGNPLPLQHLLWASQPLAQAASEISKAVLQPAQAALASSARLAAEPLTALQQATLVQPTDLLQQTAVVAPAVVAEAATVVPHITAKPQAETTKLQPQVSPALSVPPSELAAAGVVIAPAQVRQAAQIKAALKVDATRHLAKEQSTAEAEPTSLPVPASPPVAVHAQTGVFTLRPVSSVVGKAPRWDAAPSANTATPGVAFNALPAQLMQFSGHEFEVKPYAGMQFSELTARLLEQATAARAKGDGTYQATLDLNPPSLGRMSVNISVRGDSVALQLSVASGAPREQLASNLASLQRSLEEAGLHVVELQVVTVDPDGQPAKQYREQQQQPQPTDAADDDALRLAFRQELGVNST